MIQLQSFQFFSKVDIISEKNQYTNSLKKQCFCVCLVCVCVLFKRSEEEHIYNLSFVRCWFLDYRVYVVWLSVPFAGIVLCLMHMCLCLFLSVRMRVYVGGRQTVRLLLCMSLSLRVCYNENQTSWLSDSRLETITNQMLSLMNYFQFEIDKWWNL